MKKVIDYFDFSGDCFFSAFLAPIWVYAFPDRSELDTYFYLHYGERTAFEKCLDRYADNTGKITGDNLKALADMLYHVNAKKWEHLFNVYNAEYSPIENTDVYEMVKEKTNSVGRIVTDSDSTFTPDSTTTNKRAGFNSSSMVNESSSSTSGEDTTALDSTVDSEGERTHETEHRKHGNIGVTENTTMLQHEVDFWKWSFIDSICKDICDIIALSIYE